MKDDEQYTDDELSEPEERLLAELGRALGPDSPPAGLVERAAGLVAFADFARELDELLHEATTETVGVRGDGHDDRFTFEVANGSIACEVIIQRDLLVGQVLSGDVATVTLVGLDDESTHAPVDALGRFSFLNFPSGPTRLRLDDGSGRDLVTDWFLL